MNFDSNYFFAMFIEMGISKRFEKGGYAYNNNLTAYITVKQILEEMINEEVKEPFSYNRNSDAFRLGFLYCLYLKSTGLSYQEIKHIIDNLHMDYK